LPFFTVSFITSLNSNLDAPLTAENTTENNGIISNAQNTTARQPNVFLTGIPRLLVIRKGWSAFPSGNHYQGQLQYTVHLFVFLVVVSYNFTVNISKICQQNATYGHHNTQDDDIRRLLEGKLCEWQ